MNEPSTRAAYATNLTMPSNIILPVTPEVLAAVVIGVIVLALIVTLLMRRSRRRRRAAGAAGAAPAPPSLRESLTKTRSGLLQRLQSAWASDQDAESRLAELEEVLLTADVGVKSTQALLAKLRERQRELGDANSLRHALGEEMQTVLGDTAKPRLPTAVASVDSATRPHVILVAGVNGVGKTTTIGKLAHRFKEHGEKVLLVAADTFRAAAGEQLEHWANRVGVDCVRHQSGADPSAVVFDGLKAAVARQVDVVIVDTAGRLHVKAHLIEELKKIVRTIGRQIEGAPHEVLLVIDATTGQNAINQARVFQEALSLTGIVLTKLDGTAKGGAVFAIRSELGVPIRWVGLGEGTDDLQPFDAATYVDALLAPEVESR